MMFGDDGFGERARYPEDNLNEAVDYMQEKPLEIFGRLYAELFERGSKEFSEGDSNPLLQSTFDDHLSAFLTFMNSNNLSRYVAGGMNDQRKPVFKFLFKAWDILYKRSMNVKMHASIGFDNLAYAEKQKKENELLNNCARSAEAFILEVDRIQDEMSSVYAIRDELRGFKRRVQDLDLSQSDPLSVEFNRLLSLPLPFTNTDIEHYREEVTSFRQLLEKKT